MGVAVLPGPGDSSVTDGVWAVSMRSQVSIRRLPAEPEEVVSTKAGVRVGSDRQWHLCAARELGHLQSAAEQADAGVSYPCGWSAEPAGHPVLGRQSELPQHRRSGSGACRDVSVGCWDYGLRQALFESANLHDQRGL